MTDVTRQRVCPHSFEAKCGLCVDRDRLFSDPALASDADVVRARWATDSTAEAWEPALLEGIRSMFDKADERGTVTETWTVRLGPNGAYDVTVTGLTWDDETDGWRTRA